MRVKVKLRLKPISNNRKSLYLDFYPAIVNPKTGKKTRREFLKRYIFDRPKNEIDRNHNKETRLFGEQVRAKRENELNKNEIYSDDELAKLKTRELGDQSFIQYYRKLTSKRKSSNYDNWMSSLHYLNEFTEGNLKFSELTTSFCEDYKDFLLTSPNRRTRKTPLDVNSASSYFNKFKAALKQAFKDGYLQHDINSKIPSIKYKEKLREFLTLDEMNKLIKTECSNPLLKKAAIFSALTGLRFIDIKRLTWKRIRGNSESGYFIRFEQKKTEKPELLPISEQAFELLGDKGDPNAEVFEGLKYSAYQNTHIVKWVAKAGIDKDISFHNFRHTFATLQLSEGTDIYTISKMLGHKHLKTTQIYTKVMDEAKRNAVEKVKFDL